MNILSLFDGISCGRVALDRKEHALARERLKKKQKEEQAEMDKARELAWKDVQIACGHHKMNLTVGEICNDYGFFIHGWNYAIRYRTQE